MISLVRESEHLGLEDPKPIQSNDWKTSLWGSLPKQNKYVQRRMSSSLWDFNNGAHIDAVCTRL